MFVTEMYANECILHEEIACLCIERYYVSKVVRQNKFANFNVINQVGTFSENYSLFYPVHLQSLALIFQKLPEKRLVDLTLKQFNTPAYTFNSSILIAVNSVSSIQSKTNYTVCLY